MLGSRAHASPARVRLPLLTLYGMSALAQLVCNPDMRRFPGKNPWRQRDAELIFFLQPPAPGAKQPTLLAKAFNDTILVCRPKLKRGEMPPAHRFVPLSAASEYTRPHAVETEDDVRSTLMDGTTTIIHPWDPHPYTPPYDDTCGRSFTCGSCRTLPQRVTAGGR